MNRGDWVKVGARIRRVRTRSGLTQKELGSPHYTHAYISSIETAHRRPSQAVLEHIAERLGTTVSFLLTGRAPGLEVRLRLEIQRARADAATGHPEKALLRAEALVQEAREADLHHHTGLGEEVVARSLYKLGRVDEALERFRSAAELLGGGAPVGLRALAVTGAARCLFRLGGVHEAIHGLEVYLMELKASSASDPRALLETYSALIGPCFEAGLHDRARYAASEAARLAARVDDPEALACSYLNVAGVYLAQGRSDEALAAMGTAEMLFSSVGAVADAAKAAIARAMACIAGEEWESARVDLKGALEHLSDLPASLDYARALNQLGRVERLSGNVALAEPLFQQALKVNAVDDVERGLAYKELALCTLAREDRASAEDLLRRALACYEAAGNRVQQGVVLMLLGDLSQADRTSAETYRRGIELLTQEAL